MLKNIYNLHALFFLLFGALTIFAGGNALFTEVGIRTRGNIVPLVLWFNFIAGFFYVLIACLIFFKKKIALRFLAILSSLNMVVLFYLFNHILGQGAYEVRTVIAMTFRTLLCFYLYAYLSKHTLYKSECKCGVS